MKVKTSFSSSQKWFRRNNKNHWHRKILRRKMRARMVGLSSILIRKIFRNQWSKSWAMRAITKKLWRAWKPCSKVCRMSWNKLAWTEEMTMMKTMISVLKLSKKWWKTWECLIYQLNLKLKLSRKINNLKRKHFCSRWWKTKYHRILTLPNQLISLKLKTKKMILLADKTYFRSWIKQLVT